MTCKIQPDEARFTTFLWVGWNTERSINNLHSDWNPLWNLIFPAYFHLELCQKASGWGKRRDFWWKAVPHSHLRRFCKRSKRQRGIGRKCVWPWKPTSCSTSPRRRERAPWRRLSWRCPPTRATWPFPTWKIESVCQTGFNFDLETYQVGFVNAMTGEQAPVIRPDLGGNDLIKRKPASRNRLGTWSASTFENRICPHGGDTPPKGDVASIADRHVNCEAFWRLMVLNFVSWNTSLAKPNTCSHQCAAFQYSLSLLRDYFCSQL